MTHAFLPAGAYVGLLLDDAIDARWCAALLAELDRRGFAATGEHYPHDYRNNDRLVFDDPALADALFVALRARLPPELVAGGARWELCGLNPRFRACRYRGGQAFSIHRDGPHAPADDLRSHLTVQLYLDDDPARAGGRTRFYADPRGEHPWAAIAPRRGAAIVFDHRAWHDGEAVTRGVKHVLRTDAMYRRVATAASDATAATAAAATAAAAAAAAAEPAAAAVAAEPAVIGRHRGYAWRAITCRDGTLASCGRDGTVRRWGPAPRSVDLGAGSVIALLEAADGRLWCGTRSGLLATLEGERVTRIAGGLGAVLGATAAGERVVVTTSRGTLHAFDPDGTCAWAAPAHAGWAWAVASLGDVLVSCGEDHRIAVTDRGGRTRTLATLPAPLRALAALPSGELLAGDTAGGLHRVAPGAAPRPLRPAHAAAVTCLAAGPDATWASASEDGLVRRWRGDHLLASVPASDDFVTSVAFDPRGDLLCAGYDGAIRRLGPTPASAHAA